MLRCPAVPRSACSGVICKLSTRYAASGAFAWVRSRASQDPRANCACFPRSAAFPWKVVQTQKISCKKTKCVSLFVLQTSFWRRNLHPHKVLSSLKNPERINISIFATVHLLINLPCSYQGPQLEEPNVLGNFSLALCAFYQLYLQTNTQKTPLQGSIWIYVIRVSMWSEMLYGKGHQGKWNHSCN